MANAPVTPSPSTDGRSGATSPERLERRNTSPLKVIPPTRATRDQIRAACVALAAQLDRRRALSLSLLEETALRGLAELDLPDSYLGWTMVTLASAYWRDQVAAIPPQRRLLLLPHCLKDPERCPADYNERGLDCKRCGACEIADFASVAQQMGYQVLVAEGSPIVMRIILSGEVDAILGVACLNVLEKAIDKILAAGIPCMAVPLLSHDCHDSDVDQDWVQDMIQVQQASSPQQTPTYLHLMRVASGLFQPERLERLVPRARGGPRVGELAGDDALSQLDPIAATEALAYDFLCQGGKYSRPFITLAVYDALTGNLATLPTGADHLAQLPPAVLRTAVLRTAVSIETFHKASLVHDDIEDDDPYRYGQPTLHHQYGVATAINVGDFLIGMGYRLVARETTALGADTVADILGCLADAHMKLTEGQGAELAWRDSRVKDLTPLDALKLYALKTAPAFEAAILAGLRLARPLDGYMKPLRQFARYLGVAFQILNDLEDWAGDNDNKLASGRDVLGARPTVLWALALEGSTPVARRQLQHLMGDTRSPAQQRLDAVRDLYEQADVFEKARQLIEKNRDRAQAVADQIEPERLRHLLQYLIDAVLYRRPCVAQRIA